MVREPVRRFVPNVVDTADTLCLFIVGADDGSYMTHFVHAHGSVDWLEPVSEEDYAKKRQ